MEELLVIDNPDVRVEVAPEAGGRISQITVRGRPLLVGRERSLDAGASDPMSWGAYPMAPWPGRLRHGTFELDGRLFELPTNHGDHAIHGLTFDRPWNVAATDDHSITLACDLDWELGGLATQRFQVTDGTIECTLAVRAGERAMLAEVGWHPWFLKPDRLEFSPEAMYRRDSEGLATGEIGPPAPGPWDDCFVNHQPVRLHHHDLVITVESDTDHWVIFDEPDHATCVEPQSGPPDAFNVMPRRLEPNETLRRTMRISWA